MNKIKRIAPLFIALIPGTVLGGYLFSDTRPRSFIAVNRCEGTCLQANELAGLVASVGLQRFSPLIPKVVTETDKTLVVEHPSPHGRIHYVVIPKRDIKNLGELSDSDGEYLVDAFKVSATLIRDKNLNDYQLIANGPGYQTVTYLHFHLVSR